MSEIPAAIGGALVAGFKKVKNFFFPKTQKSKDIDKNNEAEAESKISVEGNKNNILNINMNMNININPNPEGTRNEQEAEDKIFPLNGGWVCSECSDYYKNKTNASHHYRNSHLKGRKISCPDCGEICYSETNLKNHRRRNCPGREV